MRSGSCGQGGGYPSQGYSTKPKLLGFFIIIFKSGCGYIHGPIATSAGQIPNSSLCEGKMAQSTVLSGWNPKLWRVHGKCLHRSLSYRGNFSPQNSVVLLMLNYQPTFFSLGQLYTQICLLELRSGGEGVLSHIDIRHNCETDSRVRVLVCAQ